MNDIFLDEYEQIAIERIQKFAKIAKAMGFEIILGFSGGKDSQVVYDLCKRSGVPFKACFNHCFEGAITLKFIREYYPEVIWRREVKEGFIQNVIKNHNGMLPTAQIAYCCEDYKHNRKFVDPCSIVGVRKEESVKRAKRTTIEVKNKSTLKKNKGLLDKYFEEHCQSIGTASVIQLKPIIDWSSDDVWGYIYKHNLPINPEYKNHKRVGCIVCPKAGFTHNFFNLMMFPKLIDTFIIARDNTNSNWVIRVDNPIEGGVDYANDKCYYICRWLNHSFSPFSKKHERLYKQFRKKYDEIHANDINK